LKRTILIFELRNEIKSLVTYGYKKLSYPERECASNMALSYGAKGISIMLNRLGVDHECDRRTDGQTKAT